MLYKESTDTGAIPCDRHAEVSKGHSRLPPEQPKARTLSKGGTIEVLPCFHRPVDIPPG